MDREPAAARAPADDGAGALSGEVFWEEVRLLGYVSGSASPAESGEGRLTVFGTMTGWAKWMEWHYPVEVVVTDKRAFRGAGMVEAAL